MLYIVILAFSNIILWAKSGITKSPGDNIVIRFCLLFLSKQSFLQTMFWDVWVMTVNNLFGFCWIQVFHRILDSSQLLRFVHYEDNLNIYQFYGSRNQGLVFQKLSLLSWLVLHLLCGWICHKPLIVRTCSTVGEILFSKSLLYLPLMCRYMYILSTVQL